MPENKDFSLRLEILDECLRNRYRNWTLQNLIDKVSERLLERHNKGASKRTIQDDLKYLKDEKCAPIEKRKDGTVTYFFYSDPGFSIKNLPVRDEEINYLKDAIGILRQVNDFKILQDVEEIVNKLENTVKTNVEGSPTIIQFEKHTTALGSEYIDDIFTAIKEKVSLRITYQPFNATIPEEIAFNAYLLKEYRNRWFIIGRKGNGDTITNLALDRIKQLKPSKSGYIPNNLFNPETYFNNLIGVSFPVAGEIQAVEIKVVSRQAPYIRTKPIHHTQEILRQHKNGDLIIRLWVICNYELRAVLLGFGSDIEVLKPASLRNDMKEVFRMAFKNYD